MNMYGRYAVSIVLLGIMFYGDAQPMIETIENNTPFQYTLVMHNDISDCSPLQAGTKQPVIEPFQTSKVSWLLGSEKPGILLRPSGFYDKKDKKLYSFLDQHGKISKIKLHKAFDAWKKHNPRYKKNIETWFAEWLCGDIALIHNHVEVFGYLLNVSMARIDNDQHYHACMVDYSEGLFSRQLLHITIKQNMKKGIIPYVKSAVGQGGLCQDSQIIAM